MLLLAKSTAKVEASRSWGWGGPLWVRRCQTQILVLKITVVHLRKVTHSPWHSLFCTKQKSGPFHRMFVIKWLPQGSNVTLSHHIQSLAYRGSEWVATNSVIAVARSRNYYHHHHHPSATKDAKQELAITLSGRIKFSYSATSLLTLGYLPPACLEAQWTRKLTVKALA